MSSRHTGGCTVCAAGEDAGAGGVAVRALLAADARVRRAREPRVARARHVAAREPSVPRRLLARHVALGVQPDPLLLPQLVVRYSVLTQLVHLSTSHMH